MRDTRPADRRFANLNLQRRPQWLNQMELGNRANVLAEAGSLEYDIDHESRNKIAHDDPGGRAGTVPEGKGLITPQVRCEQAGCNPLRTQSSRPPLAREHDFSGPLARKGEGTGHAKKIAGHQQRNHSQSSPVSPRQHTTQVQGCDLWAEESIGG